MSNFKCIVDTTNPQFVLVDDVKIELDLAHPFDKFGPVQDHIVTQWNDFIEATNPLTEEEIETDAGHFGSFANALELIENNPGRYYFCMDREFLTTLDPI